MTTAPDPAHALRRPTARVSGYELLERGLVVVLLLAYAGVHMPFLFGPWPEQGTTELVDPALRYRMRLSWIPIYALVFVLAALRLRAVLGLALASPALTLLILLCPLSALWSVAPEDTARASLALLTTCIFGVYLAVRFEVRTWLQLLALALSAAIVISLVTGLLAPKIGVMETIHPGAWRGVFSHKNVLGRVTVLTLMVLAVLAATGPAPRWAVVLGLGMAASALILSRSLTALVVAVAVGLAGAVIGTLRLRSPQAVHGTLVVVSLSVLFASLLAVSYDDLLASFGRDRTLTGRTALWVEAVGLIEHRPWLGHGYGDFWSLIDGPIAAVQHAVGWPAPNAHNGYIDLWLQLGAVGSALFASSVFGTLAAVARRLHAPDATAVLWSALMLTFMLVYNVSESVLLLKSNLVWALYVATVLGLAAAPNASQGP